MNKLGIYLHFPFCKGKCGYCDFYSLPCLTRKREYEKALCRSIRALQGKMDQRIVETVYFGGGTPSLISPEGLAEVFSALRESADLSPDAEITVEMNPESATFDLLSLARRLGVNRISFGMQSAHDDELALLGRLHRHEKTVEAVRAALDAGFDNISLDLMYGLPGQKTHRFLESVDTCLSLNVTHVSFYCLTLSESVPLFARKEELPEEERLLEMYLLCHERLEKEGFEHYEISNAARPGFRSRHNEAYWTGREYLGIGPGAHSFLNGERFAMAEDVERFILASNPYDTVSFREKLNAEDEKTEYVMLSLRRKEGLDFTRLAALSDAAFCRRAEEKFSLWSRHGLCRKTANGYALTPKGFFVSNEIISELI